MKEELGSGHLEDYQVLMADLIRPKMKKDLLLELVASFDRNPFRITLDFVDFDSGQVEDLALKIMLKGNLVTVVFLRQPKPMSQQLLMIRVILEGESLEH